MSPAPVPQAQLLRSLQAIIEADGKLYTAARASGIPRSTIRDHAKQLIQDGYLTKDRKPTHQGFAAGENLDGLEIPNLPDGRLSTEEYIEARRKNFARRYGAKQVRQWFPVRVKSEEPIGICWFGDPHVDSDGCNWPLLENHARICAETPGLYGANLGDVTDNWVGRLARLYAHSEQSRESAIQGAEILISKLGIPWIVLIRGNHDMWSGTMKDDPLSWMQRGPAVMEDWQAKFRLVFPSGREAHIHCSHHFSGQSWFHPMHGQIRQTLEDGKADLLVSGHTHEFGAMRLAMPKRGTLHLLVKARGYKFIDRHADIHGYGSYDEGASVVTVIDPHAKTKAGFINAFEDVETGADFLTFLRNRK